MRVVVVGMGSIGRRHIQTLRELGHEAVACRRRPGSGELGSLDDALAWNAEAVVVATPTALHADALRWALEHGVPAYVEKPLATRAVDVAGIVETAEARGVVVAVGYNLRFHPAAEAVERAVRDGVIGRLLVAHAEVGHYLPDWHPGKDYRDSYAAAAELGGGALLTLSHELDLVRAICGEIVEATGLAAHVSALEVDVDDVAAVVCRHSIGALSSVRMDMLDRSYNRRSRWVGEEGTLVWDWAQGVRLEPAGTVLWDAEGFDFAATYAAALEDFVDAVETKRRPRVGLRDGLRVLEVCEMVAGGRT